MITDHVSVVEELLELEAGLTAWEIEFLDNLDENWRDRELTESQSRALEGIARKMGLIET
jgi:hypothetical protein